MTPLQTAGRRQQQHPAVGKMMMVVIFVMMVRMLVMMVVMLVMMVVNIKKILLSPVLGIGRQIVDTKLSLILPLLAPIIGLKRTGLGFLRGLIDQKISLLDNFSSIGGSAGYGAPTSGYGVGRGRTRRGWTVGR